MRSSVPLAMSLIVAFCGALLFGYGGTLLSTIQAKKNTLASERSLLLGEEIQRTVERDGAAMQQKKEFEIYRSEKSLHANLTNCKQCNVSREYEAQEKFGIAWTEVERLDKIVKNKEQRISDMRLRIVAIDQTPVTPDSWIAKGEFLGPLYASVSFLLLAAGVGGIAGWLGSVAGHTDLPRLTATGSLEAVIVCFVAPVSPLSSLLTEYSPITDATLMNFFRLIGTAGLAGLVGPIVVASWYAFSSKGGTGSPPPSGAST